MSDKTNIEWCDATWNPIVGCSIVSPGCTNCYAMKQAARIELMHEGRHAPQARPGDAEFPFTPYAGLTQPSKAGPVWTGKVALASDETLTKPLRWKRARRIFVNSMGDLFHEDVPDAWIDRVFAVMALAPQHTFQVLTKRSKRMREYIAALSAAGPADRLGNVAVEITGNDEADPFVANWINGFSRPLNMPDDGNPLDGTRSRWPLPNVWLGVSAEDQIRADERIPDLLATPAAVHLVSAEPLLGGIDFRKWIGEAIGASTFTAVGEDFRRCDITGAPCEGLDWIIVGGEGGPGARPMHPDWLRSIRDQCAGAGVSFFFKQWGEWAPSLLGAEIARHSAEERVLDSAGHWRAPYGDAAANDPDTLNRVGKARAGRLLDGRTHDEFPAVRG